MVSTKTDLQTRIEDAENGLDIETAEAKDLLNEETTRSHYIQAKLAARSHWEAGKLKLLAGNPEWDTNVGEAAEFRLCHLQGTVAFYKAGEGNAFDTDWYKFPSHAETTLWLSAITGDPTQQRRIAEIVEEYIESIDSLTVHRLEAIRATIQGDSEVARDHIERLEAEADTGTYRKRYLDRKPLTIPLMAVLKSILDSDNRDFEDALETYITEDLRDNGLDNLPYNDPELVHLSSSVVGMLALAYRNGIDTSELDITLPEWVTAPEVDLIPEGILEHEWSTLSHEPSELVQKLWAKIDSYDYPEDGPLDSEDESKEGGPSFDAAGVLEANPSDDVVYPDLHAYRTDVPSSRSQISEPYGQWLANAVDEQLRDSDGSRPSFSKGLFTQEFLERAVGPLASVSEHLYIVVTERAFAFTTEFDPDSFGMALTRVTPWTNGWSIGSVGVSKVNAEDFWTAVRDITTSSPKGDVVLRQLGPSLAVHPFEEPYQEFHTHQIDTEVLDPDSDSIPAPGTLPSFVTEFTDRTDGWAWEEPPSTRLSIRHPGWIDDWLQNHDGDAVRVQAGIRNDNGSAGEGVISVSGPDGGHRVTRSSPSYGPDEDFLWESGGGVSGVVWPLGVGASQEQLQSAFDPEDGTIPHGAVGVVADGTYDLDTLRALFYGSPRKELSKFVVSLGNKSRLRLERGDFDGDYYLVYEQTPLRE
jgi:hypothetical protein